MKSLLNVVRNSFRRAPFTPLQFPTTGFSVIKDPFILEEEQFHEFKAGKYYPVNIGDVFASQYQVVGKMGFGTTSTMWLARNLQEHTYVALKIFKRGIQLHEFEIYSLIGQANPSHPGHRHVRTAVDTFELQGTEGNHHCLVLKPMWDSWRDMLRRNPAHRFSEVLLKAGLAQLYPVDIWNVGVMIWDLFEGRHLFYGDDPKKNKYTTRAHLAEVVAMLGPPPLDIVQKGRRSMEFFTEDGKWKADVDIPQDTCLDNAVARYEGEEKEKFLTFVRGMLQWRPEDRKTAAQLLNDPWLQIE
ncbi:kinase-like protein [Sodiomyces alkalinus F11]|uniref:non-specific serine/threonine protein kinase n=1 Tax=Sodiomyces alkalinus (strain CBS 110278 / VKM F-3762 / F11) TaxID=1314773 RepID=A0A3N2PZ42_SODAK|nr:kinase-like protein [Sodiomyces alkalinus F11]ROT39615.1 kinase-like protein [Sodiomyces alkalinus F11]